MKNQRPTELAASIQSGWLRWVWFVLGWAILSLVFVPEVYLYFLYRQESISWLHAVALALANAAIAFVFLPPIVWLARYAPIERQAWQRALIVHAPACLIFALSHSGLYAALCYASPTLFHALFVRFHPNLLTYWAIVGFTQAIDYFDRYREREQQLAQAELLLMKAQLQPHFLFNTLHAVSAMMREDVEAAELMLNRLSDLLRLMLDNIGSHEVALRQEIDFIVNYAAIEQVRYGDRLAIGIDADREVLDAAVPTMLLQPLVENAVRHGLRLTERRGIIDVTARRQGDEVVITVSDDGRGFCASSSVVERVGLTSTRIQLRELYGDAHRLSIVPRQPNGTCITIIIPFRDVNDLAGDHGDERSPATAGADRRRRAVGAAAPHIAAPNRA